MSDSDNGVWTLISPDGRRWSGESAMRALKAEMDSRVPATVQLRNLHDAMKADEAEFEGRLEEAYWEFDARRKGYAEWRGLPMAERDAFKASVRKLDAGASRE